MTSPTIVETVARALIDAGIDNEFSPRDRLAPEILAALSSSGYVVVPVEPTAPMISEGESAQSQGGTSPPLGQPPRVGYRAVFSAFGRERTGHFAVSGDPAADQASESRLIEAGFYVVGPTYPTVADIPDEDDWGRPTEPANYERSEG